MKKRKIIIIGIVILILIAIISLVIIVINSKDKFIEKKIANIEYDMKIDKCSNETGGYATIYEYILINIKDKKAYYIYDYYVFRSY